MPDLPKKPCGHPGCPELTRGRFCAAHTRQSARQYDRDRGADKGFYSRSQWRKLRAMKLRASPLCEHCTLPANEVDHKIDRRLRPDLAYALFNLQSLCKPCHSRKTAREHLAQYGGQ